MAEQIAPIVYEAPQCVLKPNEPMICGGLTNSRELRTDETALFEQYRDIIEQKLQAQFQVPNDFKPEPAKVRTQVVAGTNYYYHVRLPNNLYAHVRIFKPLPNQSFEGHDRSSFVHVEPETTED